MQRIGMEPRKHWQRQAESLGFSFHSMNGDTYWDESACYRFSLSQIEDDIEAPTEEIHQMCLQLVDQAVHSEKIMDQLCIPTAHRDLVRNSWLDREPHLYGRMDFAYDGRGPAKFYEYNADTPTSLYESAFFQWLWLEEMVNTGRLPPESDQFNLIQEMLIEVLVLLKKNRLGDNPLYLACCKGTSEDFGTVEYFRDCALQAGIDARFIHVEDIGISTNGQYTDLDNMAIPALFKLYPWEFMFDESYGRHLAESGTLFLEPPWKAILSNKAILPLLWQEYRGHPNLLPSYFESDKKGSDLGSRFVKKPLFSREGANISVYSEGQCTTRVDGPYCTDNCILQQYHPVPQFNGNHTLIGSWVIGDRAAGIGIREDSTAITRDSSRFLPHIIGDREL
ncbi:glutathionylspermidine synthase family protein [Spongorhabdus nitratireducens]